MFNHASRGADMPHTILRLPAVRAESGLSRSTLYLRMGQGLWPHAVRLGVRRRDAADVPALKIAAAVAAGEKSATRIGLAAASPELSCTKRTECPILTIAVMKGNLKYKTLKDASDASKKRLQRAGLH
jgi:prophage regulatory protein